MNSSVDSRAEGGESLHARVQSQLRKARANTTPHAATGTGGLIETIAGARPYQAPITALQAGLGTVQGIVQDANGNLFIATGDLGVVLKIDNAGNTTVYAGEPLANGPASPTGDGGPATAATILYPSGLALDAANNLYISDPYSETVRMVSAATGTITTVAGIAGKLGVTGDGGAATSATLYGTSAITIDGGYLYILNDSVVRAVNLSSGIISTVAGAFTSTCNLLPPVSCPATSVQFLTDGVGTIAASQGYLYIASYGWEGGPATGGILKVQLSNSTMTIAYGGTSLNTPGAVTVDPTAVAVDAAGNIDFSEGYLEVIEQLPAGATTPVTLAGTGQVGFTGDGGLATAAKLQYPAALTITPTGTLLFTDFTRVRSVSVAGTIATVAGSNEANGFGNLGPATQAGIDSPESTVVDPQGNIYIADTGNNIVREISATTGTISTVAGNGLLSMTAPPPVSTFGISAAHTALGYPVGIALDLSGHLYITSEYQGLSTLTLANGAISTLERALPLDDAPMVFDGQNTLYVGDNYQVLAVNILDGTSAVIAGNAIQYYPNGYGDGGPATQAYLVASGLALDDNGNLYIADANAGNIRVVNLGTGIIETFAGPAANYAVATGYTGDGGPATAATFEYPQGMAFDHAGHLFIADTFNCVIREIDLTTGIITTVAGMGAAGFSGDGGPSTSALLDVPWSVSADAAGNLIIADYRNDRIRRVVLHPTALIPNLSASASTLPAGSSATLTVAFSGLQYGLAPSFGVTFYDGATALPVSAITTFANGSTATAILTTSALAAGTHTITASFAGDGNYAAVTSSPLAIVVTPVVPPSFTVTATPASLTIAQGSTGTAVLSVTPQGGFNQAVTFTCGTKLPAGVTCSFSPASLTPSGSTAVTTTLTVTTTATTVAAAVLLTRPADRWWLPGGAASFACLLLMGVPKVSRRAKSKWLMAFVCACALGTGALAGCGSGSKATSPPATNPNATPAGTYALSVTAAAGAGASGLNQAAAISITVTS